MSTPPKKTLAEFVAELPIDRITNKNLRRELESTKNNPGSAIHYILSRAHQLAGLPIIRGSGDSLIITIQNVVFDTSLAFTLVGSATLEMNNCEFLDEVTITCRGSAIINLKKTNFHENLTITSPGESRLDMEDSVCFSYVDLSNCGFTTANFENAEFCNDVSFENTTFGNDGNFKNVIFSGVPDFSSNRPDKRNMAGNMIFSGARFCHQEPNKVIRNAPKFKNRVFEGALIFDNAIFLIPPNFEGAKLSHQTRFKGARFEAPSFNKADSFRLLKQLMADARNHREELRFNALEQRCLREGQTGWDWIVSWNFDSISGYGEKFIRPFGLLFVVWLFFADIYGMLYAISGEQGVVLPFERGFILASNQAFRPMLSLPTPGESGLSMCVGIIFIIVGLFHVAVNITLAALGILALRHRFGIRG